MRSVGALHVVVVARIDEIIQLLAVVDAIFDKDKAVLPHDDRVGGAVNHQEFAFQFVGFVFEAGQLVAFRIFLWGVHVAFAIHDFVVFPIQNRTAGNRDFEHFRMIDFQ